jgi:hypothetical protein
MSNQEFAKLWDDAIAQYNATIGPGNSIGDRTCPKPRSVGELLEMIEHEHGNFSAFRERQAKFRLCLKYALAPVEMLGFLVSGAASAVSSIYHHRHLSLHLLILYLIGFPPCWDGFWRSHVSAGCMFTCFLTTNFQSSPVIFPLIQKPDSSLLDCEERRSSV